MTILNPQLVGRAEHAHRAALDAILADTGLTYHDWIGLVLAADGTLTANAVAARIGGALHLDEAGARTIVDGLVTAGLLAAPTDTDHIDTDHIDTDHIGPTDRGRELYQRIRADIDDVMGRVYAGIPADEMSTAGRILDLVTGRLNAELAPAA